MAAPIASGSAFQAVAPVSLFDTRDTSAAFDPDFSVHFDFDMSADGQRFLVAAPLAGVAAQPVSICLNWLAGVEEMTPERGLPRRSRTRNPQSAGSY